MFLIQKYTQYKATQAEQQKRKVTEKELAQLNHKIDKLLTKLDEHEPEIAVNQDEECVVCVTAKATMQTYPCGHRVVCRKCFVKTIQMAVAQRLLPLRCVICRAKILRLKHSTGSIQSLPASASQYTISHSWYNVPQSASLYSVTSNTSAASAASSASSCSSSSSYKTCASSFSSASFRKSHSGYSKLGYKPLRTTSPSPSRSPQPRSSLAMAIAKKDNRVAPAEATVPLKGKLSLIQEFRREFSIGKEQSSSNSKDHPKLKLHSSKGSYSSHQLSQQCSGGSSVRSNNKARGGGSNQELYTLASDGSNSSSVPSVTKGSTSKLPSKSNSSSSLTAGTNGNCAQWDRPPSRSRSASSGSSGGATGSSGSTTSITPKKRLSLETPPKEKLSTSPMRTSLSFLSVAGGPLLGPMNLTPIKGKPNSSNANSNLNNKHHTSVSTQSVPVKIPPPSSSFRLSLTRNKSKKEAEALKKSCSSVEEQPLMSSSSGPSSTASSPQVK